MEKQQCVLLVPNLSLGSLIFTMLDLDMEPEKRFKKAGKTFSEFTLTFSELMNIFCKALKIAVLKDFLGLRPTENILGTSLNFSGKPKNILAVRKSFLGLHFNL